MARFHGEEKQSRVQTLQKPKMKESKYISSDYHKGSDTERKLPKIALKHKKEVKEVWFLLARDSIRVQTLLRENQEEHLCPELAYF